MADLGDIGKFSAGTAANFYLSTLPAAISMEAVTDTKWSWPWYALNLNQLYRAISVPVVGQFSLLFNRRYVLTAGTDFVAGTIYDLADGVYELVFKDKQIWEMELVGGVANFTSYGKPLPGDGTLSGTYPDGIVSIEGVPGRATVRVLYRPLQGAQGDGILIATTESADDGTWLITGLDPSLRYDVVFRVEGYPDLMLSNIAPVVP